MTVASAPITLRFYVAGDGYFSRQALANLECLVAELGDDIPVAREVIDVTADPATALKSGILTTPTLIATLDSRQFRFVGDLSEREGIIGTLKSLAA